MKIIKFLLKHIRRRIYLWKVDYIYNSCFVIEEGMPPSYYLTHTQEEIERDRQEILAAIDHLMQIDKNRKYFRFLSSLGSTTELFTQAWMPFPVKKRKYFRFLTISASHGTKQPHRLLGRNFNV